jgi:hypothetical protein
MLHATLTSKDEESNAGIEKLRCLGIGLLGCLAMYALLNLMAVSGAAICKFNGHTVILRSVALHQTIGSKDAELSLFRIRLDQAQRIHNIFMCIHYSNI